MKLEAEELGILANFSCTVNNHAEARRVAARLDPIGPVAGRGEVYVTHSRTRLYWTRCPACACILLNEFRDLGDFAALLSDKQNLNEFAICRRSLLEPQNTRCWGAA